MRLAGIKLKWLGAACLVAAALAWMFRKGPPDTHQPVERPAVAETRGAPANGWAAPERKMSRDAPVAGLPDAIESPHAPGSAGNEEWVAKRVEELEGLAWFNDLGSLDRILAEMRNTRPEIRKAALQAVIAFGSKDAIPKLEILARGTNDLEEQKAIADAIEYLKLPTMVEYLEENPGGVPADSGP